MNSAPPASGAGSGPSALASAWPRSAQVATAFLLGVCLTLLAVNLFSYLRWKSQPTEHHTTLIDLNRADRTQLLQVPGVGERLADRIIASREERPFANLDDLSRVQGIGPATLERFRQWVYVTNPEDKAAANLSGRTAGKRTVRAKGADDPVVRPLSKKTGNQAQPLDLNQASADELRQSVPGLGPKRAEMIVSERAKRPFQSVDELKGRVPGIGKATLEKLRPYVTVTSRPATTDQANDDR